MIVLTELSFELENALCEVLCNLSEETINDIDENGEVIMEVDDGMGCNNLIKYENQYYWIDRSVGVFLVEQSVVDLVKQM